MQAAAYMHAINEMSDLKIDCICLLIASDDQKLATLEIKFQKEIDPYFKKFLEYKENLPNYISKMEEDEIYYSKTYDEQAFDNSLAKRNSTKVSLRAVKYSLAKITPGFVPEDDQLSGYHPAEDFNNFRSKIRALVMKFNQWMLYGYSFANLYFAISHQEYIKVPNNYDFRLINDDFYRDCLKAITQPCLKSMQKKFDQDSVMLETIKTFSNMTPNKDEAIFKNSNFKECINDLASQMFVATRNHMKLNFKNRFINFNKMIYERDLVMNKKKLIKKDLNIFIKQVNDEFDLEYKKPLQVMFYNKKRLNNKKKLNQKEQTEEDAKIKYNQSIQNSFNLIILKYFQILEAFEDNVKIYNDYLEAKTINQDPNPILKYIKYCKLFSIIPNKGSFKLANIHVSNTTSGELK